MNAQIGLFLTFATLSTAFLFPAGNNSIYSYRGTVTIGTTEPAIFTSKYEVFADIHVAKLNNGTMLQLKDVTYTLYNGEGHGDDAVSKKIHVPPQAQAVTLPFVLYEYGDEEEPGISIDSKDQVWSINMKKAIALLFNVDQSVLKSVAMKETIVRQKENSGFGECGAAYEYTPSEKGHISFLKKIFNYRCKGVMWEFDYSFMPTLNCADFDAPRMFSIVRHYDVIDDSDEPYINTVYSENHLQLPGFGELDASYYAFVNQTIKLKSLKSEEDSKIDVENMEYKNLHFDRYLPTELKSEPDDFLKTDGSEFHINASVKRKVVNLTKSILNRIKNLKVQKSNISTDAEENLIVLIKELQRLNFFTLRAILEEFRNDETELDFFLIAVSMTGTLSSIKLIQETLTARNTEDNFKYRLLMEFSRNLKKSQSLKIAEQLGKDFNNFKDIHPFITLIYATIVKFPPIQYSDEQTQNNDYYKFVNLLFENVNNITKDQYTLKNLATLGSIQIKNVTELLKKIAKNEEKSPNLTPRLRALAMLSVQEHINVRPNDVEEFFIPLFTDVNEDIEVRLMALYTLLFYGSTGVYMKLLWHIRIEKDDDIRRLYYSTLVSMSESTNECYNQRTQFAKQVFKYAKQQKIDSNVKSSSYLVDYLDKLNKFGSGIRAVQYGDLNRHNFTTFYLKFASKMGDYEYDQYSVYLSIRSTKNIYIPNFHYIFFTNDYLQLSREKLDGVTFDIIIKRNNAIVFVLTLNPMDIMYLIAFSDIISYIPLYEIRQSFGFDLTVVTDMGVPISAFMQNPTLKMSKFIKENHRPNVRLYLNGFINTWSRKEAGLKIYNPIADIWHGLKRVQTIHSNFKPNITLMVKSNTYYKLTSNNLEDDNSAMGFKSIVHTEGFADGENNQEVQKSCKICKNVDIVNTSNAKENYTLWLGDDENTGLTYNLEIFNCEKHVLLSHVDHFKRRFWKTENKNSGGYSIIQVFLTAQYTWDYISILPGKGSCGIIMTAELSKRYPMTRYESSIENIFGSEQEKFNVWTLNLTHNTFNEDTALLNHQIDIVVGYSNNSDIAAQLSYKSFTKEGTRPGLLCNISRHLNDGGIFGEVQITTGQQNHNDFISHSQFKVRMVGKSSSEQLKSNEVEDKLYELCLSNPRNDLDICIAKVTSFRSYTFDVKYENVTKIDGKLWRDFVDYMIRLCPEAFARNFHDEMSTCEGNAKIFLNYPLESESVDVSITTPEESIGFTNLQLKDSFLPIYKPFSPFTYDTVELKMFCEFGVDYLKGVKGIGAEIFDVPHNWTTMYKSKNFDCEISTKITADTKDKMAFSIKIHDEVLDIKINRDISLLLNDEPLFITDNLNYYNTLWTNIKILKGQRIVIVHLKNTSINAEFRNNSAKLSLPLNKFHGACFR